MRGLSLACKTAATLGLLTMTAVLPLFAQFACAAPAAYSKAVSDFQGKRYSQALSGFQAASAANPNDPMCHYYMALCYQYMNQVAQSTQEYQWVATHSRDARLKAQAQAGMAQNQRYASTRSTQLASASGSASGGTASGGRSASGAASSSASKPSPYVSGKLKVTEFVTKWCHVCKTYDPVFDSVQSSSKYSSSCQFQRLDAEDPSNSDLVARYSITNYPTTVIADSSGKTISHFTGGTGASGLSSMIDSAIAQLPK